MKCVHAKKKAYRAFTKNLINQILNTLSFDNIVTSNFFILKQKMKHTSGKLIPF